MTAEAPAAGGRVLVDDDEDALARVVARYLERLGLHCAVAHDGPGGLAAARRHRPDVVVLDLMLPGMDGLEVARRLRADDDTFILMLTARDDDEDVVRGLAAGADDYLTKPFSPRVLAARVQALLRRGAARRRPSAAPLRVHDLVVDLAARTVTRDGRDLGLTPTELDVLATLAGDPGRAATRREILHAMWGREWFGDEHVVDVHVANLRRKLGEAPGGGRYVETVRSVGYRVDHAHA
jgi:DNA-binding response OmpR family regulator